MSKERTKPIDKELNKVKQNVLEVFELVQKQFKIIYASIKVFDKVYISEVCDIQSKIKKMQYNFLEISMWRITKLHMMASDLRVAIVYIDIVEKITNVAQYAGQLSIFLGKYHEMRNEVATYIKRSVKTLIQMLNNVRDMLENVNLEQLEVTASQNTSLLELNKKKIINLIDWTVSTKTKKEAKVILNIYHHINILNLAGDQLNALGHWIYYMKKGIMYELPAESEQT